MILQARSRTPRPPGRPRQPVESRMGDAAPLSQWVPAANPMSRRSPSGRTRTDLPWGTGMTKKDSRTEPQRPAFGAIKDDLAERIEGHIERRACGRIRDLHVVCTGETIILQ